jgi:hypothetical protein
MFTARTTSLGSLLLASVASAVTLTAQPQYNVPSGAALAYPTPNQVTVWWSTDVSATSEIAWGPTPQASSAAYPFHGGYRKLAGTLHSRTLAPPTAGTWYFRVRSTDATGASVESDEQSFQLATASAVQFTRPMVSGYASSMVRVGQTVYLGGDFGVVGQVVSPTQFLDEASPAELDESTPWFNNTVEQFVPDGRGGLFAIGSFSTVGGLPRTSLAHLLPDHGVDPTWVPPIMPQPNLYLGAVIGSTLFVYGAFPTATPNRYTLRAYDATTGALLPWAPSLDPNGQVQAMAVRGQTLYVGGTFTGINGVARPGLAALDATTFQLSPTFAPPASNPPFSPRALGVTPTTLFVGGASISATTGVQGLLLLDPTTGQPLPTQLPVTGAVARVVVDGSDVFLSGYFTAAGSPSQARPGFARLDAASNQLSAWSISPEVQATAQTPYLAVTPTRVYLTRWYFSSGRNSILAIDRASGTQVPFEPPLHLYVQSLLATNGELAIAGNPSSQAVGGLLRHGTAALDLSGASPAWTAWAPDFDGVVRRVALDVDGGVIYAGGLFTTVNGQPRRGLAGVELATGSTTPFTPMLDGSGERSVVVDGERVFVAGTFSSVADGGAARSSAAAFDRHTGALLPWDPGFTGPPSQLAVDDGYVYAVGDFAAVNGLEGRTGIARVDDQLGLADVWYPFYSHTQHPQTIAIHQGRAYLGDLVNYLTPGLAGSAGGAAELVTATFGSFHPPALQLGYDDWSIYGYDFLGRNAVLHSYENICVSDGCGCSNQAFTYLTTADLAFGAPQGSLFNGGVDALSFGCPRDLSLFSAGQALWVMPPEQVCAPDTVTQSATPGDDGGWVLRGSNTDTAPGHGWFRFSFTAPDAGCNDLFGTRWPGDGGLPLDAGTSSFASLVDPSLTGPVSQQTPLFYCALAHNGHAIGWGEPVRVPEAIDAGADAGQRLDAGFEDGGLDAGSPTDDAGLPDAGTGPAPQPQGCHCQSVDVAGVGLALLVLTRRRQGASSR